MKQLGHWTQYLATAAVTALVAGDPLLANPALAAIATQSTKQFAPVEIYVPPPERRIDGICPNALQPTIDSIVNSPTFASGRWGVLVQSLDSGATLYSRSADDFFIPASNVKLFTTAAAIQTLNYQAPGVIAPLREWIRVTNLDSINGHADALLRRLGGPQGVSNILSSLGIDPTGYRQVDGSGLSRSNLATPSSMVSVLRTMYSANGNDLFYASLPVAGMSGTLRNRFRNTPAYGRVRAKTGTLRGVRALSGYLDHPDYGVLIFSIMANQNNQSGDTLVGAIDRIVLQLARLTPCN